MTLLAESALAATGTSGRGRPRIVIAGGGFAALEAMLALRGLAGDDVALELISLHRRLAYRPAATREPFARARPLGYDLAAIAADLGAAHRVDRLEAVAPAAGSVRLASGAQVRFDALILAIGAQLRTSVPGALMFTGQRDAPHIENLLEDLAAGDVRSVIFAVPGGISWPLPLYELALLTSAYADEHRWGDVHVSIVTPEPEPLAVFGQRASELVRDVLRDRGVEFLGGRTPVCFDRDGRLSLRYGGGLDADRVIAAPNMVGRRISGIPGSWHGFVPTDERGRVEGLDHVYAAGDMTTYPVKQGGLAAQQADIIAQTIVADVRTGTPPPPERTLQVRLLGGRRPVELHAVLDADGRAVDARLESTPPDAPVAAAAPESKVFGRYLTSYLASRAPADAGTW